MTDERPAHDPARVFLNGPRRTAAILAALCSVDFGAVIYIQLTHRPATGPVTVGQIWGEAIPWSVVGVALGIGALIIYVATLVREDIQTEGAKAAARLSSLDETEQRIGTRVEAVAAYHMGVEGQKARLHADDLFAKAMKELENRLGDQSVARESVVDVEARLAEFRDEMAAAVVEIAREMLGPGGSVTPIQARRRTE